MKYTFIGDTHGAIDVLLPLMKRRCEESDLILQLGDMGLGFRGVNLPNLKKFGFIRGNHDSPALCQQHNNYAGEFGMWNDIFVVGGAYSIDWMHRVPGKSWWFDEQLTHDQREAALKAYIEAKPEVVASHEAPTQIGEQLLRDGGWRPEKWGSTQTVTADLLQRMFEAHQPKNWFFGHYHRNWSLKLKGCKFMCLNELSIAHLEIKK